MKISSKNLDKCQVRLSVALDAAEVAEIINEVEKTFVREAQMPGFRKGKIPLALVRKEFKNGIEQEVKREIVQKKYPEALKSESIDEVALADIQDLAYDENGGGFVAIVEVKPKFKLPTYKGLKIESRDASVGDDAVQAQLDRIRAAYAKYEDAKEGETVSEGDFVQIDYDGFIGGKKILEINPEAKIVGEGRGFWTQVEEGRFLPEILEALKGMKTGETKEGVKAKFDKESAPEGLKGENATYNLTLKSFRRRILPDDAEFAEKAKAESVEKLRATIRESLEKSAIQAETVRRENEAVELLLKKCSFDVPASQVRRAMDGYLQELAQRAQYSGLDADYFKTNRESIMKDAEEAATKQVRLWYILEAIAAEEKIEADDGDRGRKTIEFVLANAKN